MQKILHYCWFGNAIIPSKYLKYIEGWKKECNDYQIVLWNEENFPIDQYNYAREAYEMKKYAFVSDVARIYALYEYGGVYFDTDVEIIKNIDELLNLNKIVLGWESKKNEVPILGTGFMIFPPKSYLCKKILDYYKKTNFINKDGTINEKPNTYLIKEMLFELYNDIECNEIFENKDIVIYPFDYFTAFDFYLNKSEITNNTYVIHHFSSSWIGKRRKAKKLFMILITRIKMILNRRNRC